MELWLVEKENLSSDPKNQHSLVPIAFLHVLFFLWEEKNLGKILQKTCRNLARKELTNNKDMREYWEMGRRGGGSLFFSFWHQLLIKKWCRNPFGGDPLTFASFSWEGSCLCWTWGPELRQISLTKQDELYLKVVKKV